ncbi:LVIVD repeat-containing protein [Flavobacterium sp. RSB2_4_14]|uniref:LVIVD repeat-containing protein n=1 Tax=Flavobacterium sp. RSB2_4_14 TaxID=3447665 RepID=UPI003F368788
MKKIYLLSVFVLSIFAISCDNDDNSEQAKFAVPTIKSLANIRSSVSVGSARQTHSDGKIYVTENYLFYIAQEEGVHIFNNLNPAAPVNIAFMNLEGVHDISVKGNYLFADNFVDLLVFDISDIQNITLVRTVENAIAFSPTYPEDAEYYDYIVWPSEGEIITGFTVENRARPQGEELVMANDALAGFESSSSNSIGTGGSYASFQINDNALYTIDAFKLNVFNIANPVTTFFDKEVYMTQWFGGGVFETLFIQKDILFVGSTTGMYTVNATDEFNPYFVSGFAHATACDPVVVFGNTAYITVRGGSTCGAIEDQINVIDVTDISNPTLLSTYLLNQPYGLGIKNNVLYVGCGTNGLKIFNAANSANLTLQNSYPVNVKDIIPLDSHLIVVGNNKITQYTYGPNFTLIPMSEINL